MGFGFSKKKASEEARSAPAEEGASAEIKAIQRKDLIGRLFEMAGSEGIGNRRIVLSSVSNRDIEAGVKLEIAARIKETSEKMIEKYGAEIRQGGDAAAANVNIRREQELIRDVEDFAKSLG